MKTFFKLFITFVFTILYIIGLALLLMKAYNNFPAILVIALGVLHLFLILLHSRHEEL